jgi:tetratricopeptide (TPR) repeat protein
MELARFIFWTALKTLGLAFLSLLAVKGIAGLPSRLGMRDSRGLFWLKRGLSALVLLLAGLGAWSIGYDVAAENYARTSLRNLEERQVAKAYANASKAVALRPGVLRYWQALEKAKFAQRQYASIVADVPALRSLSEGTLGEEDAYRLAASYYFLAQYDQAILLCRQMIKKDRMYAAPYVLEGYAYTAQRDFDSAEHSFLAVLQMFPTHEAAVEGLAHVHFLRGRISAALAVLNETARFPFPPAARARFEALKALYAQ